MRRLQWAQIVLTPHKKAIDLCMTPQTCSLSILAHGLPVCPAGRIDWPSTASISRQLMYRPDSFSDQNPCWRCLSWQPSFCEPCLRSRLALARRGLSNGPGPSHRYAVAFVTPSRGYNCFFFPYKCLRRSMSEISKGNCVNMNSILSQRYGEYLLLLSTDPVTRKNVNIKTSDPHEAGGEEAECRVYLSAIVNLIADRVVKTHHRWPVNMRGNSHFFI